MHVRTTPPIVHGNTGAAPLYLGDSFTLTVWEGLAVCGQLHCVNKKQARTFALGEAPEAALPGGALAIQAPWTLLALGARISKVHATAVQWTGHCKYAALR